MRQKAIKKLKACSRHAQAGMLKACSSRHAQAGMLKACSRHAHGMLTACPGRHRQVAGRQAGTDVTNVTHVF